MRIIKSLVFCISIISVNGLNAQVDSIQMKSVIRKEDILMDLINRLHFPFNRDSVISYGLVNTLVRQGILGNGPVFNENVVSNYYEDTSLLSILKSRSNYEKCILVSLTEIDNRTYFINSYEFHDPCKSCPRLYFELGPPIEGWENLDFFLFSLDPDDESSSYKNYYTPQISIPLFSYTIQGDPPKNH